MRERILPGALVTHGEGDGVVMRIEDEHACVRMDDGRSMMLRLSELRWTTKPREATSAEKRITISKVLFNQKQNELLQRWCELAAANGGSFAIHQEWIERNWYTTYTIEWPEGIRIPEEAQS